MATCDKAIFYGNPRDRSATGRDKKAPMRGLARCISGILTCFICFIGFGQLPPTPWHRFSTTVVECKKLPPSKGIVVGNSAPYADHLCSRVNFLNVVLTNRTDIHRRSCDCAGTNSRAGLASVGGVFLWFAGENLHSYPLADFVGRRLSKVLELDKTSQENTPPVSSFDFDRSTINENIGSQLSFGRFISAENQSASSPPQRESKNHQQRIGNFQTVPEYRPVFGNLIASLITIVLASSLYRRFRVASIFLGFYGFAGILFGVDFWALVEWGFRR